MTALRALSVRQPWGDAIMLGGKDVENRSRDIGHRGTILIHASAGMSEVEAQTAGAWMKERGLTPPVGAAMEFGGIIGAVDLIGTTRDPGSKWFIGPVGWILANPRPLPFIPCRGTVAPILWTPPPEVLEQVLPLLGLGGKP